MDNGIIILNLHCLRVGWGYKDTKWSLILILKITLYILFLRLYVYKIVN